MHSVPTEEVSSRLGIFIARDAKKLIDVTQNTFTTYLKLWGMMQESVLSKTTQDRTPGEPYYRIKLDDFVISEYDSNARTIQSLVGGEDPTNPASRHPVTFTPEELENRTIEQRKRRFAELHTSLETLGGMPSTKARLAEIGASIIDPVTAKKYGVKASHFYLYGPPGTGKTSVAKAFSKGISAELISVKSSEIISPFYGLSSKNIAAFFGDVRDQLEKTSPVVLFIDEIDTLIGLREHDPHGYFSEMVKTFNIELDSISADFPNKILLIGATNSMPNAIDPSISRSGRLEAISVPLPTADERMDIWGAILAKDISADSIEGQESIYGFDIDLVKLAEASDEMTGADVHKILSYVKSEKFLEYVRNGESQRIMHDDILRAILRHRKS